jgi:hypothetical protein
VQVLLQDEPSGRVPEGIKGDFKSLSISLYKRERLD